MSRLRDALLVLIGRRRAVDRSALVPPMRMGTGTSNDGSGNFVISWPQ